MNKINMALGRVPERIAVFRALKLGDLLCAVPAFRAVRRAFPNAHIALISLPWASEFVARFPNYFDEFIAFPGWPGLPEQPLNPAQTVQFLSTMQSRQWDLVLQQQGNGTLINAMLALFGSGAVAGFHPTDHPERFAPNPDLFMPYPPVEHEIIRHSRLMEFLGIPVPGTELEFPLTDADQTQLNGLLAAHHLTPGSYVCLHAGGISGRRWPADRFARVADALAERGLTVVLTGTQAELLVAETVQQQMHHPSVRVVGETNLGSLAALLKGSALLVSNDTGVSHVAAACAVPSVVVFTSANPAEWAPLDQQRHRVVLETEPDIVARVVSEAIDLLNHAKTEHSHLAYSRGVSDGHHLG
ncbi:ADP-heptose:LPS heptosyltransferase [Spirosoma lacussanchae]|uniref:glycosyltransferase family 9 protein n=1 Tax=Spirosoma lacussanchae TaxID=1884249 RepID=UPI001FE530E0|nr:glycosyltransferase family 9 protein [Spirosoma lacussanchae]